MTVSPLAFPKDSAPSETVFLSPVSLISLLYWGESLQPRTLLYGLQSDETLPLPPSNSLLHGVSHTHCLCSSLSSQSPAPQTSPQSTHLLRHHDIVHHFIEPGTWQLPQTPPFFSCAASRPSACVISSVTDIVVKPSPSLCISCHCQGSSYHGPTCGIL